MEDKDKPQPATRRKVEIVVANISDVQDDNDPNPYLHAAACLPLGDGRGFLFWLSECDANLN